VAEDGGGEFARDMEVEVSEALSEVVISLIECGVAGRLTPSDARLGWRDGCRVIGEGTADAT
jgi:hypothetical protein